MKARLNNDELEARLEAYRKACGEFAVAKALRQAQERMMKVILASGADAAKASGCKTVAEQERQGYLTDGYSKAIEEEAELMRAEEMAKANKFIHELWFELYRTERADERGEKQAYRVAG